MNSKELLLLGHKKLLEYINIPGNPKKLAIGRTYYQVGIRVKTNLTLNQFTSKWNNTKYEVQKDHTARNWVSIKAAEVQNSDKAFAVRYLAGTTERGDYDTIQQHLQEICNHPVEISYQTLNQTTLTKNLWREARNCALQINNNTRVENIKGNYSRLPHQL